MRATTSLSSRDVDRWSTAPASGPRDDDTVDFATLLREFALDDAQQLVEIHLEPPHAVLDQLRRDGLKTDALFTQQRQDRLGGFVPLDHGVRPHDPMIAEGVEGRLGDRVDRVGAPPPLAGT